MSQSAYINDNSQLGGFFDFLFPHRHKLNMAAFQNAPDDKVTIFRDAKYNGKSRSFSPGGYVWLGIKGRDEISSVKIPEGFKLEAWAHGSPGSGYGPKAVWTQSKPYVGRLWNDAIDTIRISRSSGAASQAESLFKNAKKGGMMWPLAIVGVLGIGGYMFVNADNNGNNKTKKQRGNK